MISLRLRYKPKIPLAKAISYLRFTLEYQVRDVFRIMYPWQTLGELTKAKVRPESRAEALGPIPTWSQSKQLGLLRFGVI